MTTGTRVTRGEVPAGIDMTVTAAAAEAEAAVRVLVETVEETNIVMRGVSGVDLMKVLPLHAVAGALEGAYLLVGHLHHGEGVLMGAMTKNVLLLQRVFLLVEGALILEAGLLAQMLMSRSCAA